MGTITVGVDLAKQVFSVCVVDGGGRVGERRDLKREAFAAWLVQLPPETVVAMPETEAHDPPAARSTPSPAPTLADVVNCPKQEPCESIRITT